MPQAGAIKPQPWIALAVGHFIHANTRNHLLPTVSMRNAVAPPKPRSTLLLLRPAPAHVSVLAVKRPCWQSNDRDVVCGQYHCGVLMTPGLPGSTLVLLTIPMPRAPNCDRPKTTHRPSTPQAIDQTCSQARPPIIGQQAAKVQRQTQPNAHANSGTKQETACMTAPALLSAFTSTVTLACMLGLPTNTQLAFKFHIGPCQTLQGLQQCAANSNALETPVKKHTPHPDCAESAHMLLSAREPGWSKQQTQPHQQPRQSQCCAFNAPFNHQHCQHRCCCRAAAAPPRFMQELAPSLLLVLPPSAPELVQPRPRPRATAHWGEGAG